MDFFPVINGTFAVVG